MYLSRIIAFSAILSILFTSMLHGKTQSGNALEYVSPLPGSRYNKGETSIIIRFKYSVDVNSITPEKFSILGSITGKHIFKIVLADDNHTVILKPDIYFALGENVTCRISNDIGSNNSSNISTKNFTFKISDSNIKNEGLWNFTYFEYNAQKGDYGKSIVDEVSPPFLNSDPSPPDFPKLTVTKILGTAPGYIFASNFPFGQLPSVPFLMILGNIGNPVLYKKMNARCFDFKVQNNTFTYFDLTGGKFYAANASFSITDSFYCGNGYSTDVHELLLLPDNHAYMMSYDPQRVDMSQVVPGGDTDAVVSGLIIQEIDADKNVIFQWRSWDHFQITDATHEDLLAHSIDYVHGNAIDLDHDGNVLISSRHMDEITKINRQTGNIMWRLGGKNNQFTFINDPIKFSYQHAIRKLANGNYLLFDNGNYHTPPFSRAVEYKLDEINKTATLVWQYRNTPDVYGSAMGNAQRLPNGNTLIGWGSANPTVTEVTPNGTKVFEMSLPNGVFSYRVFRHTWDGAPEVNLSTYSLFQNYPNPFNPVTYIKYDLLEDSYVSLKIYDIAGKEITTLVSENQQRGTYLMDFNGQTLSSGIYFYKLTTNNFEQSRKMVLVK
jgi:hypothetical protein